MNKGGKTQKPGTWSLLETIYRFVKKTDKIRRRRMFKARRLLTIDGFIKGAMKKSIFYIELMNRPGRRNSKTENNSNSAGFNNWRESLIIVNPRLLRKTPTDPTSLVTCKRAIRMKFVSKNPLAGDDIGTRWFGNERPGVVLKKSIEFVTHGRVP